MPWTHSGEQMAGSGYPAGSKSNVSMPALRRVGQRKVAPAFRHPGKGRDPLRRKHRWRDGPRIKSGVTTAGFVRLRPIADIEYLHQSTVMSARLFTIVCDFRGGTYVSQVRASDERDAVRAWAELLIEERPIKVASSYLAKSIASNMAENPPVALNGLTNAWCITGSCGGDFMLADIIETVSLANGS